MFRIGEFAQIAQVSARQLRHYDQLGMLRPDHTDPRSGYRYYGIRQLPRLNRILALKELGLSLEQIGPLLEDQISAAELRGMLTMKRAQVEQLLRAEEARLRHIESRITEIDRQGRIEGYDVVVKSVTAQPFPSLRRSFDGMGEVVPMVRSIAEEGTRQIRTALRDKLIVVARNDAENEKLDLEIGFSLTRLSNALCAFPAASRRRRARFRRLRSWRPSSGPGPMRRATRPSQPSGRGSRPMDTRLRVLAGKSFSNLSSVSPDLRKRWLKSSSRSTAELFRNVIHPIFHNQIVGTKIRNLPANQAVIDAAKDRAAPDAFGYLESLAPNGFLVGRTLTVADIAVVSNLIVFHYLGYRIEARFSKLNAYFRRHIESPTLREALAAEKPFVDQMGLDRSFVP